MTTSLTFDVTRGGAPVPVSHVTPGELTVTEWITLAPDVGELAASLIEYGIAFVAEPLGARLVLSATDRTRDRVVATAIVNHERDLPAALDALVISTTGRLIGAGIISIEQLPDGAEA